MGIRIDKWLWAMRIFKTRTLAADECKKGRIMIDGIEVKPSRLIHLNEIIIVRKPPMLYTYRAKALTERRLPAKELPLFLENLTTPEELDKLDIIKLSGMMKRERGTGRPTKRDRRDIDNLKNIIY
jgi:ribosome-associated heat shock protein Hsp15